MKKLSLLFAVVVCLLAINIAPCFAEDIQLSTKNLETKCPKYVQVRARHILVKTESEAIKIRKEIVAGKSFEQAAKQYSICPSAEDGGDLGYFCRGMMVPEFEKVAFSLPVGKISEPVHTKFGWHLILVVDKK